MICQFLLYREECNGTKDYPVDLVKYQSLHYQRVGYAELASAVSNAGGLGIVRCHIDLVSVFIRLTRTGSLLDSHNPPLKTFEKRFVDVEQ